MLSLAACRPRGASHRLAACSLVLAISLAGCGDEPSPMDAGLDGALVDVGTSDAHAEAALDATRENAPAPADGGLDAAHSPDGGTAPDTGDAGPPALHGCVDFVDRRAPDAERVVRFDSSPSLAYTPACLLVARGQSVVFEGPFSRHPLTPGRVPGREDEPEGTSPSPIPAVEEGTHVEVPFADPGRFPFFCPIHAASGMVGVVAVE